MTSSFHSVAEIMPKMLRFYQALHEGKIPYPGYTDPPNPSDYERWEDYHQADKQWCAKQRELENETYNL